MVDDDGKNEVRVWDLITSELDWIEFSCLPADELCCGLQFQFRKSFAGRHGPVIEFRSS